MVKGVRGRLKEGLIQIYQAINLPNQSMPITTDNMIQVIRVEPNHRSMLRVDRKGKAK